nr:MAG TPA: hypothetical protein [Caudoviricetes sp.]
MLYLGIVIRSLRKPEVLRAPDVPYGTATLSRIYGFLIIYRWQLFR